MDSSTPTPPSSPLMEINPPRRFNMFAVWIVNAYGLTVVIPVVVSIFIVSMLRLGFWTAALPLLSILLTAMYLPFASGNSYVIRLVRALKPATNSAGYVVQLTLMPRLRSGQRAAMEDADDVGWLTFTDTHLEYYGDSVRLSVPYEKLGTIRLLNVGLRGLWLCGNRVQLTVPDLPDVEVFEFAERSAFLLPQSRRTIGNLHKELLAKMQRQ